MFLAYYIKCLENAHKNNFLNRTRFIIFNTDLFKNKIYIDKSSKNSKKWIIKEKLEG